MYIKTAKFLSEALEQWTAIQNRVIDRLEPRSDFSYVTVLDSSAYYKV